jgi:hypothetical protein
VSFPNQAVVAEIRSLLERTAGVPVQTLLAEQDALLGRGHQSLAVAEPAQGGSGAAQATSDVAQALPRPTQRRRRVS